MEVQVRVKFVVELVRRRLVTRGAAIHDNDKNYKRCNNIASHTIGLN